MLNQGCELEKEMGLEQDYIVHHHYGCSWNLFFWEIQTLDSWGNVSLPFHELTSSDITNNDIMVKTHPLTSMYMGYVVFFTALFTSSLWGSINSRQFCDLLGIMVPLFFIHGCSWSHDDNDVIWHHCLLLFHQCLFCWEDLSPSYIPLDPLHHRCLMDYRGWGCYTDVAIILYTLTFLGMLT